MLKPRKERGIRCWISRLFFPLRLEGDDKEGGKRGNVELFNFGAPGDSFFFFYRRSDVNIIFIVALFLIREEIFFFFFFFPTTLKDLYEKIPRFLWIR